MDTSNWSVSDVSNYLNQIGLGQYSLAFVENDISGRELQFLNDEYLIELGVKSIGHRIKLNQLIKSIKNIEYSFPSLKVPIEENDIIHPLPQNIYQQLFINSIENDDKNDSQKEECKVCHKLYAKNVLAYHQNVCLDTFNKCKLDFARRSLNITDGDIIDLLVGNVPKNAIKLEKCQFCGKKISPKLFQLHQKQCKRKLLENKKKENEKAKQSQDEKAPKYNYKEQHDELIQMIKMKKKEARERVE